MVHDGPPPTHTRTCRKVSDGKARRAFVQAYAVAFTLSTMALIRAQLTESALSARNWLVILVFFVLSIGYVHFAIFERISVFEGLDKTLG